jgi:hypothetical protein
MNRAEGLASECGPFESESFEAADRKIRTWARTAPDSGGYDKVDVEIEVEEGIGIGFRFDMDRQHATHVDLLREASAHVKFYAGKWRPAHIDARAHVRILRDCTNGPLRNLYARAAVVLEGASIERAGASEDAPCAGAVASPA